MKPTPQLAQAIRRSIMDQVEADQCLNSDTLDQRILSVLLLSELTGIDEVKTKSPLPAFTNAQLAKYLKYSET